MKIKKPQEEKSTPRRREEISEMSTQRDRIRIRKIRLKGNY
jgi:hypothetical protein